MFGSTWGNNNAQQQQQPQQGVFGQPSAFAPANTTNAFGGTTSAFGQPAQPQANPMFGNLGATNTTGTGTTSAFGTGAFGGGTTSNTSAFGLKPATGFGAFGGAPSAFGGATTSAFGQPANTSTTGTSAFGQPAAAATTSAFGSTSTNPIFGGSKFGAAATGAPPVVTTGTSSPSYSATSEQDGSVTHQYQSIVCMPAYAGYSFEELRVQDYAQNRKAAAPGGGAFGTTAFGAAQPTTGGIFGAQPAQPQSTGLFGATNTTAPSTSAFGAFGTNPSTSTALTTTGAFGAQPQQNAFGATNTAPSAFGQPQTQPTTSAFGGTTGAFGATANKPAFGGFGGTTGTSAFGGGATTTPAAFGTQPQQPAQTGIFGATQPATGATSAFGGGAFGATANKPSIFGTTPAATQPATNTFGFGTQPQTQPQQNQGTSLFGGGGLFGNTQNQQQQNQQQQPTTNLFGQPQQQQPQTNIFGGGTTGGLFGNTQNQQQNQPQQGQGTGLFGGGGGLFNKPAQPATTGLFGTQPQPAQPNSLFGGGLNQQPQQNSLFGPRPAAAPGLATSMSQTQAPMFGSQLGASTQQGSMTASINQPIAENVPLFSMLPPGPRILDAGDSPKKKTSFFVDVPTRSPVPRLQTYTPAASKLRGFSASTVGTSAGGNPFTASSSFTNGRPGALNLNKTDNRSSSVGPEGFLGRSGSPALGSGARQSVKKVILDKKVDASELFVKNTSPGGLRGKVTFSPQLSIAAREKEGPTSTTSTHPSGEPATPTPSKPARNTNRFTAAKESSANIDEDESATELGEGEYWTKPEMSVLKQVGFEELSSFKGLVVGRKGYGEIHFLEPVDLTGLPKLTDLLGDVVRFDDRECSVYPDAEDGEKPAPGSGLNVKARLILDRCWTLDKATREPIKDPNHPQSAKHLKRLKAMKETHFENFDIKAGTWTFTVDHF